MPDSPRCINSGGGRQTTVDTVNQRQTTVGTMNLLTGAVNVLTGVNTSRQGERQSGLATPSYTHPIVPPTPPTILNSTKAKATALQYEARNLWISCESGRVRTKSENSDLTTIPLATIKQISEYLTVFATTSSPSYNRVYAARNETIQKLAKTLRTFLALLSIHCD